MNAPRLERRSGSSVSMDAIHKAFIRIATSGSGLPYCGDWIPATFWAHKITRELRLADPIDETTLRVMLEAKNSFGREFVSGNEPIYDGIKKIEYNQKRVKVKVDAEDQVKKRMQSFFCVVTTTKAVPSVPIGTTLQKQYQKCWDEWNGKVPSTNLTATRNLTVQTIQLQEEEETPPIVTPTSTPTSSDAEESDVEETELLVLPDDLRKLFQGIVNPRLLENPQELFNEDVDDDVFSEFRKRIEELGCQIRKEANTTYYDGWYKMPTEYRKQDVAALDPTAYPALTGRFGIPLTLPALRDVGKSLFQVAEDVPEVLEFKKFGGCKGSGKKIVSTIVPSSNEDRLYANARLWLPAVFKAAVDEDSGLSMYDAVSEILRAIDSLYPAAFKDVALARTKEDHCRLDPMLQKALIYEASLTQKQMELVKKYTIFVLGRSIWQPRKVVDALDVSVFPAVQIDEVLERKAACHYRPIDKLMKWTLDKTLAVTSNDGDTARFNGSFDVKKLTECHLIMAGDHGQGAFRMVISLLLFSKEGNIAGPKLEFEVDELCGFVECIKESREVLETTIAKPLNQSLWVIQRGEKLVFCRSADGKIFVEWGEEAAAEATQDDDAEIIHSVPAQLFHAGDLSYQLLIQGRHGMSSHWCFRCQKGWHQWQGGPETSNSKVGAAWTNEKMRLTRLAVKQKRKDRKKVWPQDVKGCKAPPLFDAIDSPDHITPLLHAVDLFLNTLKDLVDAFIDYRLENRPPELVQARALEAERTLVAREFLREKDLVKDALEEILAEAGTESEDDSLVAFARDALEKAEARYEEKKNLAKSAAAKARKMEGNKEYGALTQPVRLAVDDLLANTFHILRSSYHGGDYEGNYCRKFMRKAEEAMGAIQTLLLEIPREARAPGCTDNEIREYIGAYTRMFQYFDLLSHYAYQPYGTLTDSDLKNVRQVVDYMDRLWRRLSKNTPPKVHAWQHMVEDLQRFRGLKNHHESKIEVAHQVGKRTDLRFRSLAGSIDRKITCALKHHANSKDPAMLAQQQQIKEERARKFGEKSKAARQLKLDEAKRKKAEHREEILRLPEIEGNYSSMLDLAILEIEHARSLQRRLQPTS